MTAVWYPHVIITATLHESIVPYIIHSSVRVSLDRYLWSCLLYYPQLVN